MSQVTEQSVRFQTALASIKLIQASAVLDLTEDDFDFLTSNKVWIATDRSRARRCVERQAHADGWFIVFDTLTLADDRLEAFYDNPNALRDYFRDIGRMVLAAEGRKANDSHADCYQYFCVPEYGTANGRLHFHAVHFMRTLPTGS